jgi:lipid-binding SYLF domain-containing protein
MAENKAVEVFKELPSWAKGVVVIGVLGIGYIIYNRIYKSLKDRNKTQFQR